MSSDEIGDEAKRLDAITRRIADCLEAHLHEHGWQPYRYPSGEHKGVHLMGDEIHLFSAPSAEEAAAHPVTGTGESFVVSVQPARVWREAIRSTTVAGVPVDSEEKETPK